MAIEIVDLASYKNGDVSIVMQTFTRGGYPHLFCLVSFAISRTPAEDTTSGPECGVEFSVLPKSILTNCNIDLNPHGETHVQHLQHNGFSHQC